MKREYGPDGRTVSSSFLGEATPKESSAVCVDFPQRICRQLISLASWLFRKTVAG
jgi:hypothetical protein